MAIVAFSQESCTFFFELIVLFIVFHEIINSIIPFQFVRPTLEHLLRFRARVHLNSFYRFLKRRRTKWKHFTSPKTVRATSSMCLTRPYCFRDKVSRKAAQFVYSAHRLTVNEEEAQIEALAAYKAVGKITQESKISDWTRRLSHSQMTCNKCAIE